MPWQRGQSKEADKADFVDDNKASNGGRSDRLRLESLKRRNVKLELKVCGVMGKVHGEDNGDADIGG